MVLVTRQVTMKTMKTLTQAEDVEEGSEEEEDRQGGIFFSPSSVAQI
jgi:hypothetical protein